MSLFSSVFFRFLGDFLATSSRLALTRKIQNTNSLSGISLKTQILYLFVYVFRYLDLLSPHGTWKKLTVYNSFMKVVYISFQAYLISLFYGRLKFSYSKKYDTFNIPIFLVVSMLLSLFFKDETDSIFFDFFGYIKEYLYTCSLILESLAILPQLVVTQDSGECEKLTAVYITLLGLYRLSYLVYFVFGMLSTRKVDTLLVVTSLIQSVLYIDFFRVYFGFLKNSPGYRLEQ
ncbi:uncharacterized protein VICG_00878 [Vittaforma corneae ATCC 50505]|uniref:ER lumen protein-retaining receptor n=1 Tax=Vittaforma corneae (strain ATCC 50505) TaxID=993615 RepID=L2GMG0_VITCO|nr:uncharacterized protein VICG_00878 [Vittaforma corneae ATCC 50505]ELA42031.1 hypothetical protein VICG_00878 [Vittaforma corneae ATCC 50505]